MKNTFRQRKRPVSEKLRTGRYTIERRAGRRRDSEAGDAGDVAAGKTFAVVATRGQLIVAHREQVLESAGGREGGHDGYEKSTGYHWRPLGRMKFDHIDAGHLVVK